MLSKHVRAKLLINECGERAYLFILQAEDLHIMLVLGWEVSE